MAAPGIPQKTAHFGIDNVRTYVSLSRWVAGEGYAGASLAVVQAVDGLAERVPLAVGVLVDDRAEGAVSDLLADVGASAATARSVS